MSEGCKKQIFGDWKHYPCSRKAVIDGYCKQHHPDNVKKRREDSDNKWKEKQANTPLALALKKIKSQEGDIELLKVDNALLKVEVNKHHRIANKAVRDVQVLLDEKTALKDKVKELENELEAKQDYINECTYERADD